MEKVVKQQKPLWLTSEGDFEATRPRRLKIKNRDLKSTCRFCKHRKLREQISHALVNSHSLSTDVYNLKIMNDLIYAMPTQMVSIFKDYLYFDDPTE